MFNGLDKDFLYYAWLFIVSLIGGVLSYIKRQSETFRWRAFFLGVACSMFTAYIVYESAFFFFSNEKFSVALGGLGAWIGTDLLLKLEDSIENFINQRIKNGK